MVCSEREDLSLDLIAAYIWRAEKFGATRDINTRFLTVLGTDGTSWVPFEAFETAVPMIAERMAGRLTLLLRLAGGGRPVRRSFVVRLGTMTSKQMQLIAGQMT